MHQDDSDTTSDDHEAPGGVNQQFGEKVKECRQSRGWSQRQLAEMLRAVDLKMDPSAITRIERGSRDVKLGEAVAIATVLEFPLDSFVYSREGEWMMREISQVEMTIRARKALLDAIRQVDRWVNNADKDTEYRLIAARDLDEDDYVMLYTYAIRKSQAFVRGGSLGHGDGDNFAVYHNDNDQAVKEAIVDAVTRDLLLSETEFGEAFTDSAMSAMINRLAQHVSKDSSDGTDS